MRQRTKGRRTRKKRDKFSTFSSQGPVTAKRKLHIRQDASLLNLLFLPRKGPLIALHYKRNNGDSFKVLRKQHLLPERASK